jgi:hypothetical protein
MTATARSFLKSPIIAHEIIFQGLFFGFLLIPNLTDVVTAKFVLVDTALCNLFSDADRFHFSQPSHTAFFNARRVVHLGRSNKLQTLSNTLRLFLFLS